MIDVIVYNEVEVAYDAELIETDQVYYRPADYKCKAFVVKEEKVKFVSALIEEKPKTLTALKLWGTSKGIPISGATTISQVTAIINDYLYKSDYKGWVDDWIEKTEYKEGVKILFKGVVYLCLKSHTSAKELTPDQSKELWEISK